MSDNDHRGGGADLVFIFCLVLGCVLLFAVLTGQIRLE